MYSDGKLFLFWCAIRNNCSSDQLDFRLYGVIEYISSFIGQNCASQMRKTEVMKRLIKEEKILKKRGKNITTPKVLARLFVFYKKLWKKKKKYI